MDMNTSKKPATSRICTFPDQTTFHLNAILDVWQDMIQVGYYDEGLPQVVWVHRDSVSPLIQSQTPDIKDAGVP